MHVGVGIPTCKVVPMHNHEKKIVRVWYLLKFTAVIQFFEDFFFLFLIFLNKKYSSNNFSIGMDQAKHFWSGG